MTGLVEYIPKYSVKDYDHDFNLICIKITFDLIISSALRRTSFLDNFGCIYLKLDA